MHSLSLCPYLTCFIYLTFYLSPFIFPPLSLSLSLCFVSCFLSCFLSSFLSLCPFAPLSLFLPLLPSSLCPPRHHGYIIPWGDSGGRRNAGARWTEDRPASAQCRRLGRDHCRPHHEPSNRAKSSGQFEVAAAPKTALSLLALRCCPLSCGEACVLLLVGRATGDGPVSLVPRCSHDMDSTSGTGRSVHR
jgi:hypothetical protein